MFLAAWAIEYCNAVFFIGYLKWFSDINCLVAPQKPPISIERFTSTKFSNLQTKQKHWLAISLGKYDYYNTVRYGFLYKCNATEGRCSPVYETIYVSWYGNYQDSVQYYTTRGINKAKHDLILGYLKSKIFNLSGGRLKKWNTRKLGIIFTVLVCTMNDIFPQLECVLKVSGVQFSN